MPPIHVKVARIGNSRGIRIPAAVLERFAVGDELILEERADGILLRVPGSGPAQLSWEDTALAMAAEAERWAEWDSAAGDGLAELPWAVAPARRVAEAEPSPRRSSARRRKS